MREDSTFERVARAATGTGRVAAVLATSALASAMWLARWHLAEADLLFLPWNLFLAWVPWLAARGLAGARTRLAAVLLGALWLLFLPNAPYLVTDLVHLRPRPPAPLSYDVLLFASFALAGCALGWGSIELVHARFARTYGRARAAAAVVLVALLTGFGVYLGRFLRWNSWDLVAQPRSVVADAVAALTDPHALGFTALFAAFVGAGYLLLAPPRGERAYEHEQ
jgi:uncharacterized membrane protein